MAELTERQGPVGAPLLDRLVLLRWLYVGRLTFVTGVYAGAVLVWTGTDPENTLVATATFLVALLITPTSFWYTHILRRRPNQTFLYAQAVLDVVLVTGIVHATGGPDSNLEPMYILVIGVGALLLPLPGGLLIGGLASMAYLADLVWGFQSAFTSDVALQIGLFSFVAVVTGLLGDRLRSTGIALASELRQLRLDTGDILTHLTTGVLTVDGAGRLAYANPSAEQLLGLDAARFMGQPVLDEVERIAPGMGRVLEGSIKEGRSVARFRITVDRDGSDPVRLGVSTAVLERAEEETNSATAIFQDITDLERIGELNMRAERLEAVAALSASLAHEIKNPLASIRSSVEQLAGNRISPEDRTVLQDLVLTESDRLSRLLSEFLEYSGLKIGSKERVDVVGVVDHCLAVGRQHPDAVDVEIRGEVPDGPVFVMGDRDLLHRALFNLVLNAAQAAGAGGCVVVSVVDQSARLRPRATEITNPVRIEVRDSGPGIEAGTENRIFDPFFTTRPSGSGLGLAVVHRSVEAHQGVTFVDRGPEGGARFVIFMPGIPGGAQGGSE